LSVVKPSTQQSASSVERIVAVPAPAEGLLLPAAPDIVDRGQSQSHDVEGVQHPDGVGQAGAQRGRVAAERVEPSRRDGRSPGRVLGADPLLHNASRPSRYDIEQLRACTASARQRDDAGDELGVRPGAGGQERRLVHADRSKASGAGRVIDQWLAVVPGQRACISGR
jgi:hypothetical protein